MYFENGRILYKKSVLINTFLYFISVFKFFLIESISVSLFMLLYVTNVTIIIEIRLIIMDIKKTLGDRTIFFMSTLPSVNRFPAIELKNFAPARPPTIPIGVLISSKVNNSNFAHR